MCPVMAEGGDSHHSHPAHSQSVARRSSSVAPQAHDTLSTPQGAVNI